MCFILIYCFFFLNFGGNLYVWACGGKTAGMAGMAGKRRFLRVKFSLSTPGFAVLYHGLVLLCHLLSEKERAPLVFMKVISQLEMREELEMLIFLQWILGNDIHDCSFFCFFFIIDHAALPVSATVLIDFAVSSCVRVSDSTIHPTPRMSCQQPLGLPRPLFQSLS